MSSILAGIGGVLSGVGKVAVGAASTAGAILEPAVELAKKVGLPFTGSSVFPFMGNIIASMNAYGVSRNNRFEVRINPPPGFIKPNKRISEIIDRTISTIMGVTGLGSYGIPFLTGDRINFMCEVATFPGRTFATKEVQHLGPYRKTPYSNIFADATFTFRVGRDMYEKQYFDIWQNMIMDPITHEFGYYSDFITDIEVRQLSTQDSSPYAIKLIEAFPVTVTELTLDHSQENAIHKMNVTFAYRKWLPVDIAGRDSRDMIGGSPPYVMRPLFGSEEPTAQHGSGSVPTYGGRAPIQAGSGPFGPPPG